ncbi:MAG: helix-turn-helix domain-containing protein [bacterium]|jgi:hypothetical protein|nr:helix-turn-helix domain-containing protein [bacterium]
MIDETTPITEKFKPAEEMVISDLETLKVLADPMRINILEYLSKPGTVKQVAEKLNKPPTKLYYHFNLLEKHGLIQMVETRIVSGIIEKHYQIAARMFRLEKGLLSPGNAGFDEGLEVTLAGLFGDTRNDIYDSLAAGVIQTGPDAPDYRRLLMTQARLNLTPEQARSFYERLLSLLQEYDVDDSEVLDGTGPYKVLLMLHPTSRNGLEDSDEE